DLPNYVNYLSHNGHHYVVASRKGTPSFNLNICLLAACERGIEEIWSAEEGVSSDWLAGFQRDKSVYQSCCVDGRHQTCIVENRNVKWIGYVSARNSKPCNRNSNYSDKVGVIAAYDIIPSDAQLLPHIFTDEQMELIRDNKSYKVIVYRKNS